MPMAIPKGWQLTTCMHPFNGLLENVKVTNLLSDPIDFRQPILFKTHDSENNQNPTHFSSNTVRAKL